MPLTRLKEEYLEQDGVRFLMEDEAGSTVACRVSHEALRDHADRMHFSGADGAVFDAYRELIEEVASEAHDAEGPFDAHGRILVGLPIHTGLVSLFCWHRYLLRDRQGLI